MQALALPGSARRRAIALELMGTPTRRGFVVRGATREALQNAVAQLRAQYPQADIRPLCPEEDPLRLEPGEAISGRELRLVGEAFLSLRTWQPQAAPRPLEGADPLLGLLGALGQIRAGLRVVAQLALLPAADAWSQGFEGQADTQSLQRLRLDYSLRERDRMPADQGQQDANAALPLPLIGLGLVGVLGWVLWQRLQLGERGRPAWLPVAVWHALSMLVNVLHSHARVEGVAPLILVCLAVLLVMGLLGLLGLLLLRLARALPPLAWWQRGRHGPIYDPDRVATKTQQPAYQARLRLYVIGPADSGTPQERQAALTHRTLLLEHLTAAYRQFHLAGGARFVVVLLAERQARRLVPALPAIPAVSEVPAVPAAPISAPCWLATGRRRRSWIQGLARSHGRLSLSEVATLWHLPQAADISALAWLRDEERARTLPAPRPLALQLTESTAERGSNETVTRRSPTGAAAGMADDGAGDTRRAWVRRPRAEGRTDDGPPARPPQATDATPWREGPGLRAGILGRSRHAGQEVLVLAPPDLFARHTLAVAKTGKGKSTLLLLLARLALSTPPDASSGSNRPNGSGGPGASRASPGAPSAPGPAGALEAAGAAPGLLLLDPHGDLATAFLGLVPAHRREDVLVVDLADTAFPIGLNPLDVLLGRARDKAVENLLVIFAAIWRPFWGPRMENALEFALKTLYEVNRALVERDPQQGPDLQFTLLDVAPLLSLPSFRHRLLAHVRDAHLLAWWAQYYEPLDQRLQLEIINPVLTKLAKFSSSQVARRIVGQGRSTLDLAGVVRDGGVLLVNTARGHIGADTAALVGATLLGLLRMTLEEQSRHTAQLRCRLSILVDEFQTIPGADFGAMLAELRKYGASFALATQALAQLDAVDPVLRPTVLANVDHLLAFAVSAEDARLLVRELDEVVTERDLINLEPLAAYAKLTLDGRRLPVFSLHLDPSPSGDEALRHALLQASRARIARPAAAVDAQLAVLVARHTPRQQLETWVRVAAGVAAGETNPVDHGATAAQAEGRAAITAGVAGGPAGEAGGAESDVTAGPAGPAGPVETAGAAGRAGRVGRAGGPVRRRRTVPDPLSLLGIARRPRTTRTSPFDFLPDPSGLMDADLRPTSPRWADERGEPVYHPSPARPAAIVTPVAIPAPAAGAPRDSAPPGGSAPVAAAAAGDRSRQERALPTAFGSTSLWPPDDDGAGEAAAEDDAEEQARGEERDRPADGAHARRKPRRRGSRGSGRGTRGLGPGGEHEVAAPPPALPPQHHPQTEGASGLSSSVSSPAASAGGTRNDH
jgi:hypothetical protein